MIWNPIVGSELLRAARHRWTYWVRVGLPVSAALLLGVRLWLKFSRVGPDWREAAEITWSLFATVAWLQLGVLSVLAYVLAQRSVGEEWSHETMEVLSTTPLGPRRMLTGKLLAVLGKVLFAALALLPFSAMLFHAGHVPWEVGLGSVAVITGSVVLCGTLGLVAASARPRTSTQRRRSFFVRVLLVFIAMVWLPVALPAIWSATPLLAVLLPPLALHHVLTVTGVGPLTPGRLSLVNFCVAAAMASGFFVRALASFRSSFEQRLTMPRKPEIPADLLKDVGVKRPPLGSHEDPLVWQEKLPRENVPWFAAVTLIVSYPLLMFGWVFYAVERGTRFRLGVFPAAALVAVLAPALYGAMIFAREKAGRTAPALLLTGCPPGRFLWAKVKAVYWLMCWPLLILAGLCGLGAFIAWWGERPWRAGDVLLLLLLWELALVGPALSSVAGMVFGLAAGSPTRALLAVLAGPVLCVLIARAGFVLAEGTQPWLAPVLVAVPGVWLAARMVRRPTGVRPWQLSLFLGLNLWLMWGFAVLLSEVWGLEGVWLGLFMVVGGNLLAGALGLLWWRLAVRVFERGMSAEVAEVRGMRVT